MYRKDLFDLSLIVILALFIVFLMHLFLVRVCGLFKEPFKRQKGVIVSFILGFFPLALIFVFWVNNIYVKSSGGIICSAVYLFLIYSLYSYFYFHIFNMSETARRIRILAEGLRPGGLKKDELADAYSPGEMVENRLRRLLALKELKVSAGKYLLARGILVLPAKIIFSLRKLLLQVK